VGSDKVLMRGKRKENERKEKKNPKERRKSQPFKFCRTRS
jgi:hypothetical protein